VPEELSQIIWTMLSKLYLHYQLSSLESIGIFFSELACKKHATDQQYFITTAYITALKEYYKDDFNGIIYPSSMTEMEGLNIVMTPKAVDKFLEVKEAFMYKLIRNPKKNQNLSMDANVAA
jgi:hypothetical protein